MRDGLEEQGRGPGGGYPVVELRPKRQVLWACEGDEDPALEQYRILRTKLVQRPEPTQVVLIGSPCPDDGKSTTAVNLAGVLALRKSVVLVDCDLRNSTMAATLGLGEQPGLHSVLRGGALEQALVRARTLPNLAILPAGKGTSGAAELMELPGWVAILERLREEFEYVICDGPPMIGFADFALLERLADATLLVVRANHTNRLAMGSALESIDPNKFMGLVLNQSEDWFLWRSRSDYGQYDASPVEWAGPSGKGAV